MPLLKRSHEYNLQPTNIGSKEYVSMLLKRANEP